MPDVPQLQLDDLSSLGPVLVTGGTGFLGGRLVRTIVERGGFVRFTGRDLRRGLELSRLHPRRAEYRPVDLRDRAGTIAACHGMRYVVHSGAHVAPWGEADDYFDINVDGTENVISGCHRHRIERLVYISTPSVMTRPRPQPGLTEADPVPDTFISLYAETKMLAEHRITAARRHLGLEAAVLRPKAIYGPGDTSILPRIVEAARRGRLVRFRGCDPLINLTHVDDVVQAILRALLAPAAAGNTYFITGGEEVRLWALVDELLERLDVPRPRRELSPRLGELASRGLSALWSALPLPGEPPLTPFTFSILAHTQTYDISAARRDLGYAPRVPLSEGMDQVVDELAGRAPAPPRPRLDIAPDAALGARTEVSCTLLNGGCCRVRERLFTPDGGLRTIRIPALFALVEHPDRGFTLFDTGYSTRFLEATEPLVYRLYRHTTPVQIEERETAVAQLRRMGIEPEQVQTIVVSHFDPDHIGGLCDFPGARIVCSWRAWDAVRDKRGLAALQARLLPGHLPADITARLELLPDLQGPPVHAFSASFDLFGDGSVRLVELPGHAPGQLGALVQLDGGRQWLLAADAVWHRGAIAAARPCGIHARLAHDRPAQERTHQLLRQLHHEYPDVVIVPSHCPQTAADLLDPARAAWKEEP